MSAPTLRIGLDWGGTKIEAIVLDREGRERARRRVSTPRDYDASIATGRDLVLAVEAEVGGKGTVGIGLPGSPSPATGLIRNANSVWLNGRPFGRDLSAALDRPVKIENDANCFAVSEAVDGAGAGRRVVVGVIIGTGCGSGIAIGGEALTGHNGIAGEMGHASLPNMREGEWPGPRCWCGRHGCLEVFVSGTGFADDHARVTGKPAKAAEIVAAMRAGDPEAEATYRRYADRLARGLAMVGGIVDPDVFVLGGGMSNVEELYRDLPGLTAGYAFSDTFTTPIVKAAHGDSSGVRGAAWLWGR